MLTLEAKMRITDASGEIWHIFCIEEHEVGEEPHLFTIALFTLNSETSCYSLPRWESQFSARFAINWLPCI